MMEPSFLRAKGIRPNVLPPRKREWPAAMNGEKSRTRELACRPILAELSRGFNQKKKNLLGNFGGRQHADPPLELSVAFSRLVLVEHALKDEAQAAGIHGQRLIASVADKLAVADIIGPRLHARGRSDVPPAGDSHPHTPLHIVRSAHPHTHTPSHTLSHPLSHNPTVQHSQVALLHPADPCIPGLAPIAFTLSVCTPSHTQGAVCCPGAALPALYAALGPWAQAL